MALILTDSQQVKFAIAFQDKRGNPATAPGGKPVWSASDPTVLSVVPADDGLSAVVSAVGPLGNAQVQVQAGMLTGTAAITIVAGDAATIALTAEAPTDEPAAPSPAPAVQP